MPTSLFSAVPSAPSGAEALVEAPIRVPLPFPDAPPVEALPIEALPIDTLSVDALSVDTLIGDPVLDVPAGALEAGSRWERFTKILEVWMGMDWPLSETAVRARRM